MHPDKVEINSEQNGLPPFPFCRFKGKGRGWGSIKTMNYSLGVIALVLLCAAIALPSAQAQNAAPDFFVAPNGNDANPGTKEKPFATFDKARLAVRTLKTLIKRRGPIIVAVRGGTYFLKETLVFAPEDGGSETNPVIYQAYGNEKPILSGGQLITNWRCSRQSVADRVARSKRWQMEFHAALCEWRKPLSSTFAKARLLFRARRIGADGAQQRQRFRPFRFCAGRLQKRLA